MSADGPPIDDRAIKAIDAIGRAADGAGVTFVGVVFAPGGARAVFVSDGPKMFGSSDAAYAEAASELWTLAKLPDSIPELDEEDEDDG